MQAGGGHDHGARGFIVFLLSSQGANTSTGMDSKSASVHRLQRAFRTLWKKRQHFEYWDPLHVQRKDPHSHLFPSVHHRFHHCLCWRQLVPGPVKEKWVLMSRMRCQSMGCMGMIFNECMHW